jgi:hypothetical protein
MDRNFVLKPVTIQRASSRHSRPITMSTHCSDA